MANPFEKPNTQEGAGEESQENSGSPFNTRENEILDKSFSQEQKEQASDELKRALLEAEKAPGTAEGSQFKFEPEDIEDVLKRLVPNETERNALTQEQKEKLIETEENRIRASQDDNKNTKAA